MISVVMSFGTVAKIIVEWPKTRSEICNTGIQYLHAGILKLRFRYLNKPLNPE